LLLRLAVAQRLEYIKSNTFSDAGKSNHDLAVKSQASVVHFEHSIFVRTTYLINFHSIIKLFKQKA